MKFKILMVLSLFILSSHSYSECLLDPPFKDTVDALSCLSNTRVYNINTDDISANPGHKRICTMTLNSPNEKDAFIKHSRTSNESVDYVELTPKGSSHSRNEWLQQSCELLKKKNVYCDELILSSHFGPRLYGDGHKEIDLDFLEKMSCEGSCSNLFSHLKNTYLFACNTLSGNTDDHRKAENQSGMNAKERASSQQNYVVIQMAHDASRSWAEEASEARYGKYGNGGGFGDRFLRIFSNSKPGSQIYGFTSVDDRGSNNARYIQEAFSKGQPLEVVMKKANMIKKPGSLDTVSGHLKTVSCQLSKYSDHPDAVMKNIKEYYAKQDPYRKKLFPKLIQFTMDHYTRNHTITDDDVERPDISRNTWSKELASNSELKTFVLDALKDPIFPSSMRMMWSTFASKLGWIQRDELQSNLAKGLTGLMRPPYNTETNDDVLHFAKIYPDSVGSLNMNTFPKSLMTNPEAKSKVKELLRSINAIDPPGRLDPKILKWLNVI